MTSGLPSEARKNWFRLLDEVAAGEVVQIRRGAQRRAREAEVGALQDEGAEGQSVVPGLVEAVHRARESAIRPLHQVQHQPQLARANLEPADACALFELGRFHAVMVHAYYAAFHCARALLFQEGLEPKTHSHFVQSGRLTRDQATALAELEADRQQASYDPQAVFDQEQAQAALERAEAFARAAQALLGL